MKSPSELPIWDDAPWPSLPSLEGPVSAEVCVIGLGGSGLSAVRALQARGVSVVAIDAARVADGAAGRNGGLFLAGLAPFYHEVVERIGRLPAARLYERTLAEMDRMEEETPTAIRRVGSLRIAATAEELEDCQRQHAALVADGFPVRRYAGPEGDGLLFPTDGVFHPVRRCRALALEAIAHGARLFEGTRAVHVGPGRVETERGEVRCARVIVAVDGGLDRVLPQLAGRVRTARLQMLATAPVGAARFPRPVYRRWGYDYWQQLEDGRIALGGFRDRAEAEEWTHDRTPSATIQGHAERFLRETLGVAAPITHRWGASVAYTASGLPILEEVERGVVAAGAYSGTGNVVGAMCARAAVEMALDGRAEVAELFAGVRAPAVGYERPGDAQAPSQSRATSSKERA